MSRTKDEENEYRRFIVKAIENFWLANMYAPSLRDIADSVQRMTGSELPSTSVIAYHINVLQEEGVVVYEPNISRTVRLSNMTIDFVADDSVWYCEKCQEYHTEVCNGR